ncbi:MAG: hypothetical protein M3281_03950 [Chloroflexota bacterium]|nr:hypothetical protein [Chloroflexota bacterium]
MTELIWDGKYTADGKRVAPVRLALPFQDVETVNESAQTRSLMLDLFASNRPTEWRNRLIRGDKKYVLPSLLPARFQPSDFGDLVALARVTG